MMPVPSWENPLTEAEDHCIKQATAWFYRTRIKQPRDTAEQIALECGEPLADVEAWIAEAYRLLSLDPGGRS